MSIYLLPQLPSLLNPLRFLRYPAICPFVRPARRRHISVTLASMPPFDSCYLRNMLCLQPYPPPPSQSHPSLFLTIYRYIYILSLTFSLLSLTHSLSLSISSQPLSLPTSYSLSHSQMLNYPFSYYMFSLYLFYYSLSHTHTFSALSRASTSPISVIPCNKIYRGAELLPLVTVNRIYRNYVIRSILLVWIRPAWIGSVWLLT